MKLVVYKLRCREAVETRASDDLHRTRRHGGIAPRPRYTGIGHAGNRAGPRRTSPIRNRPENEARGHFRKEGAEAALLSGEIGKLRLELSGSHGFNRPSSGAACVFPSDGLPNVESETVKRQPESPRCPRCAIQ